MKGERTTSKKNEYVKGRVGLTLAKAVDNKDKVNTTRPRRKILSAS